MVNIYKSAVKSPRGGTPVKSTSVQASTQEVIFVSGHQPRQAPGAIPQTSLRPADADRSLQRTGPSVRSTREAAIEEEADDVIDLGAPRRLRRRAIASAPSASRSAARRPLPPNPRLYPGPKPKPKPKPRRAEAGRSRRGKRPLRRPVPNSRLYRPAPPRAPAPPPPPLRPRASWPPPAPPRALDTASRVALRLGARTGAASPHRSPTPARCSSPASVSRVRRLVVTLPPGAARYHPTSEHFRSRASAGPGSGESTPPAARLPPRTMEAAGRQSVSPDDRSEGNEPLSAPSEFLAEFLSAIMRRQYAEALKYCRLILQYEPHNATARGFYPLLRHKVARAQCTEEATAVADGANSSSDEADVGPDHSAEDSPSRQDMMEHSAESDGESEASAAGDHSELELDSSDALHSSPSLSLSRRTDRTDHTDSTGASGASASASAGCWESTGSASRSDPDVADDNGNAAPAQPTLTTAHHAQLLPDDLENDNAAGGGEPHHSSRLKSESVSSLRRLRAQFACSIK